MYLRDHTVVQLLCGESPPSVKLVVMKRFLCFIVIALQSNQMYTSRPRLELAVVECGIYLHLYLCKI